VAILTPALDWTITADCPQCTRPVRLVRRRDGGSFVACSNRDGCGFTCERDEQLEHLALEVADLRRRYMELARVAVPRLLEDATGLDFGTARDTAQRLVAALDSTAGTAGTPKEE
jgi:ssDNA-binding Zn-finger/Zn-ribbon topoisomerase 1